MTEAIEITTTRKEQKMEAITITEPNTSDVSEESNAIVVLARGLDVNDPSTYQSAGEMLVAVKGLLAKIGDKFSAPIRLAHEAHKSMLSLKRDVEAVPREAETLLKTKIGTYDRVQRAKREETERSTMLEREKLRRAEEDRRLQEATKLEDAGFSKAADAVVSAPIPVAPAVAIAPPPTPKLSGVSTRDVWKFRIDDASAVPRKFCIPDEKMIGGLVRSQKGATDIPGVTAYAESVVSARA